MIWFWKYFSNIESFNWNISKLKHQNFPYWKLQIFSNIFKLFFAFVVLQIVQKILFQLFLFEEIHIKNFSSF